MKTMSLLAVAAAVLAFPLAAQQPGGQQPGMMHAQGMHGEMMRGMGMDSMMATMMRSMAFAPEHLLMRKTALRLTSQQEARLTALHDAAQPIHDAAARAALMHAQAMEQAMRATTPDTNAVQSHFQAAHAAMGAAHWAMVSASLQARGVLTDAQRRQLEAMADSMHTGPMMRRGGEMQHR